MTLKHFIDRPVLAAVISIVIVLGGIIGVATLPVEQYPDIAPPTVMVRASYPGASAETIQKSVIIPLEEAINGVENMMYIKSEASNAGSGSITVYFKQGTNADMAACTMNGANEVAVAAFLARKCAWLDIVRAIRYALEHAAFVPSPTLADYAEANAEARALAAEFLQLKN